MDTTGITDADGLEGATFSYQWLADEAEIDGATGSTHTPTSGDAGKAITVRVDFTDDAGNEESLTSATTAAVAAGLRIRSATLDGATLTLTYNEILDSVSLPVTTFTVSVNGGSRSVSAVSVSGSSVTLTLASEAAAGDAVTVDYTRPEGRYFIRDIRGRVAPSFSVWLPLSAMTLHQGRWFRRSRRNARERPGTAPVAVDQCGRVGQWRGER